MMTLFPDKLPFFYFTTTLDSKITGLNDSLYTALGYSEGELTGKNVEIIFALSARIFFQTHLAPLLKLQDQASELYITLEAKDQKQLSVLCNVKKIVSQNDTLLAYVCIEVENRKKFENRLIEARTEAIKALEENTLLKEVQKHLQGSLETLDLQLTLVRRQKDELAQLSHIITHELKEPIRKLSIFLNLLTSEDPDHGLSKENIYPKLENTLAQLKSVVSGMQQYSLIDNSSAGRELVDANEILSQVNEELKLAYPSVILTIVGQHIPQVYGIREQLKLLFYNVLENAVRFRKPALNAIVEISAVNLQLNKFRNTADKYEYEGYLRIRMKDNGIGFDPQYKEQIFDLFKRLHLSSGRGIGLALCKKIAENHGGFIEADGGPGDGTVINLFLPSI